MKTRLIDRSQHFYYKIQKFSHISDLYSDRFQKGSDQFNSGYEEVTFQTEEREQEELPDTKMNPIIADMTNVEVHPKIEGSLTVVVANARLEMTTRQGIQKMSPSVMIAFGSEQKHTSVCKDGGIP